MCGSGCRALHGSSMAAGDDRRSESGCCAGSSMAAGGGAGRRNEFRMPDGKPPRLPPAKPRPHAVKRTGIPEKMATIHNGRAGNPLRPDFAQQHGLRFWAKTQ